jgi:Domain of unknown function (DUF4272)
MRYLVAAIVVLFVLAVMWRRVLPQATHRQEAPAAASGLIGAERVARRVLCLAALVQRAKAEYRLRPAPGDVLSASDRPSGAVDKRINSWLSEYGLWASVSSEENVLFEKPFGQWSTQEVADGQWREEAMATLLWALHSDYRMPDYDRPALTTEIEKLAPTPNDAADMLRSSRLRPRAEISHARDIAELWLWRARTTQLKKEEGLNVKGYNLDEIIAMTAKKAREEGLFVPVDNDFPALGKPYRQLSESEWQTLRSIATERLYALNWLCGYADDWDKVPTGT